jgi:hypothetical protein
MGRIHLTGQGITLGLSSLGEWAIVWLICTGELIALN